LETGRQLGELSGGLTIIVFGGMQMGWNLYFLHVFYTFAPLIWLVVAGLGSLSSWVALERISRRNLYVRLSLSFDCLKNQANMLQ
jgi:hypothetical protein